LFKVIYLAVAAPIMGYALLLIVRWERRRQFRRLNCEVPPIEWELFEAEYLRRNKVATIVYDPDNTVGGVALRDGSGGSLTVPKPRTRISRPEVRFWFSDSSADLESIVEKFNAGCEEKVHLVVDECPNAKEMCAMALAVAFLSAVVAAT